MTTDDMPPDPSPNVKLVIVSVASDDGKLLDSQLAVFCHGTNLTPISSGPVDDGMEGQVDEETAWMQFELNDGFPNDEDDE